MDINHEEIAFSVPQSYDMASTHYLLIYFTVDLNQNN